MTELESTPQERADAMSARAAEQNSLARRIIVVLAIAGAAISVDQVSKWLILERVMVPARIIPVTPFFNLTLGFNTGVSFGIGKDFLDAYPFVLALFKIVVATGLAAWAATTQSALERTGLSLIAGGAVGNAIDRWLQGAVTDFLDLHWAGWHWPTFNMADVAITSGVGLILLAALPFAANPRRASS